MLMVRQGVVVPRPFDQVQGLWFFGPGKQLLHHVGRNHPVPRSMEQQQGRVDLIDPGHGVGL